MAEPKYTLNRTGAEVAEAITKALNSAQKAVNPTEVITDVKFKDNTSAYSARLIDGDTLELFAVALETETEDIYEAEDNTP